MSFGALREDGGKERRVEGGADVGANAGRSSSI